MTQEETGLVAVEHQAPMELLVGTPAQKVTQAKQYAEALAGVVKNNRLYVEIGNTGRQHVLYEGWTTLGSLMGVHPVVIWTKRIEDGWESRVEARTLDGRLVGSAEAMCLRSESSWNDSPEYAIRSMAQTRAASKALKMPLGFVMAMAGFDTTPAEEIAPDGAQGRGRARSKRELSPEEAAKRFWNDVAKITNTEGDELRDFIWNLFSTEKLQITKPKDFIDFVKNKAQEVDQSIPAIYRAMATHVLNVSKKAEGEAEPELEVEESDGDGPTGQEAEREEDAER